MIKPRTLFRDIFMAAIDAADPARRMGPLLPAPPPGRVVVVGAGKAAAQMAAAFEQLWNGPVTGLVVTRRGNAVPCRQIEVIEAAHPVPDAAGLAAASRIMDLARDLTADDVLIALISGGGSALLPLPPAGLSLADKIETNRILLASGAPISAMNTIRKHLSAIKGGRLAAAAAPARCISFIVSDIPGDNPAHVASGPTVPDPASRQDALDLVASLRLDLPAPALAHLHLPAADAPLATDGAFARNQVHIIASAAISLEAAAAAARARGIEAVILSDAIEGEARDIGMMHAAIAREVATRNRPFRKPVLLLSGGETTVTLGPAPGRGGRNSEFLLAFALAVEGCHGIHGFAADTDGIDGSEANAGAFCDGSTAARIRRAGIDPFAALRRHDAWAAFSAIGDLFITGPTGTNINDLRAILIT